ncbi:NAD+ synthase [Wenzhouxiangella marina]|uniref:Glutamine-dependent NAD(+) synthetase n=1 Tax=Wenzhouxiangella marina TaxID=1579979 RepID=A0A0K0XXA8_9GAMM|nr:NAD+ synthase [Wenzhouxiangella marina]AKS42334.1 Putative glutamine-dependent NAD(+) synthetase (NAD(+) synthase (Glutamine-hydrolyzing)) (NadE) [Wenzhouxiangella marina]MBB6085893.1 NAD+ synthase (glutamine-hydrolyzing) [Wenzhouxiangella marina]
MLKIALAQDDFLVGHITGNRDRILESIARARDEHGADLIVFPELALTGYPPEDLVLRPGFMRRTEALLAEITRAVQGIDVLVGHPRSGVGEGRYNSMSWLRDGRVLGSYDKWDLPNYAVFDERRYFLPGDQPLVIEVAGVRVGIIICEDTWTPEACRAARAAGAQLIVSANASPYYRNKHEDRSQVLRDRHAETGLPLIYLNCVGGQDELVFDGHSLYIDGNGRLSAPAPLCEESLLVVGYDPASGAIDEVNWPKGETEDLPVIYRVLQRGLRDYVLKNKFESVVFGLSGGIDSSLTAAIAADALGPDRVLGVMMPSRHTSELSLILATEQIDLLGIHYDNISIEPIYQAMLKQLAEVFDGRPENFTEENLQARARGNIVMALSNKFGHLPLATSNKSELATGYSTIYGDMCGGFSPIKDCLKQLVYELSNWRNGQSPAIPQGIIDRPPSAELRPDQTDQDSLPPYEVLDRIITAYVEEDRPIADIVALGIEEKIVRRVAGMVLAAEYKRRQGAPGPRITRKAFGRDRRYPITSGWRDSGIGS